MKVIIRTLQQKTFEIDAEPHQTVLYLKERFGAIQGESLEYIKLFYSGKYP
ncbi:hypothetical protein FRC11_006198 [Ceratobasidium sp. 423]|nr:hypothetical protein FRC11_006198 [Ceratobasidium sp. 423]